METTRMEKMEAFLRLSAIFLLILTSCLVGLDTQTKLFYGIIERKATFKDLNALIVLVHVDFVIAGYNLLQLGRCIVSKRFKGSLMGSYVYLGWLYFLLDQITVYIAFSINTAALQASVIGVTGTKSFQWIKLCNTYTRFCFQIGGALLCGLAASIVLFAISSISAFNLFRLYSPKQFLLIKSNNK